MFRRVFWDFGGGGGRGRGIGMGGKGLGREGGAKGNGRNAEGGGVGELWQPANDKRRWLSRMKKKTIIEKRVIQTPIH